MECMNACSVSATAGRILANVGRALDAGQDLRARRREPTGAGCANYSKPRRRVPTRQDGLALADLIALNQFRVGPAAVLRQSC